VTPSEARPMAEEGIVKGATSDIRYSRFSSGEWTTTATAVPSEMALSVYVNKQELATLLCTPAKLNYLVLGFLYSEGVIDRMDDIASMSVCEDDSLAEVALVRSDYSPPVHRTLASGCGGGVTFDKQLDRVESSVTVTPGQVSALMRQLNEQAKLYRYCGGVHTAGLGDGDHLVVIAEDIGRHNTVDKIMGECLIAGQPTKDRALVATGRISSEMLSKAARMQVPIVISRSSPTDRAIALARELGITLVGYARGDRLSVYSCEERLEGHNDKAALS
jgi:FdhD protein